MSGSRDAPTRGRLTRWLLLALACPGCQSPSPAPGDVSPTDPVRMIVKRVGPAAVDASDSTRAAVWHRLHRTALDLSGQFLVPVLGGPWLLRSERAQLEEALADSEIAMRAPLEPRCNLHLRWNPDDSLDLVPAGACTDACDRAIIAEVKLLVVIHETGLFEEGDFLLDPHAVLYGDCVSAQTEDQDLATTAPVEGTRVEVLEPHGRLRIAPFARDGGTSLWARESDGVLEIFAARPPARDSEAP